MLLHIVVHLMLPVHQCYGQGICSQLEVQPHSLVVRFAAFLPPSYLQLWAGGARHQLSLQISCDVEWLCTACADGSEHDGAHVVPLPAWLSPTTCIGPVASFSLPGNCRHRYADALPPMPRAGSGRCVYHQLVQTSRGGVPPSALEVQPHSLVVRFAAFLPPSYLQLWAGGARHQLSLQISCEVEWLCTACADGSEHDGAHVVPLPAWLSPTTCIGPVASFSLPGNCRHRYADALPPHASCRLRPLRVPSAGPDFTWGRSTKCSELCSQELQLRRPVHARSLC